MKQIQSYVIFTTPTCHFCHDLKQWLEERGISNYQLKDVAGDMTARQEMVEKSQQMGVPVSLIKFTDGSEEVVVGFAPQQLSQVLGLAD